MFMTLQEHGRQRTPHVHFAHIVSQIGETLRGKGMPNPALFQDPDLFAAQYLRYNLSRKANGLYGIATDPCKRKADTINGFLARECVNAVINAVRTWGYSSVTDTYESDLLGDQILYRAREIIRDIVGDRPNMDRIIRKCNFGNGASATMKRTESQGANKFLYGRSVTKRLRRFIAHAIQDSPVWSELTNSDPIMFVGSDGNHTLSPDRLVTVGGAVLDQVNKTAEINRVIIKEPELNGYFQKGIGSELRYLLRQPIGSLTDGVDLNYSGDDNSRLARYGSITGRAATVDGERASDSLTIALYEFLFPEAWHELFLMARSPFAIIEGEYHRLEMMSGMGNGFTFEAESIIFYAIGLAAAERSKIPFAERMVSIHGDDLIIPSDVYTEVSLAYASAGIVINQDKSYSDGPFRESCGGHYFNGESVKPFWIKDQDGRSRGDWFWLANSLLLWLNERSDWFRNTITGKRLVQILKYLNWYASSGEPRSWRCPVDASRRAGLYSEPPKLRGGSWKTRMVVAKQRGESLPEDGLYLQWLNKPGVVTVYDLLFPKRKPTDRYEATIDVIEVDRYKRLIAWNGFSSVGISTPLWWSTELKSTA